jgi:hypothetical protein
VTFLVDGFNLYHSVRDAGWKCGGKCFKWLDLRSFCASYLHHFGRDAKLEDLHYFSALATHLGRPDVVIRHQTFLAAIRGSGAKVEMGKFKRKTVWCATCQQKLPKYEEKESDVAMATRLLSLLVTDACDTAVLVTGDTDLAPAIRAAKALFPKKRVCMLFPYNRTNAELQQLAAMCLRVKKPARYGDFLFPDPLTLSDGRVLRKPVTW